jgi:hypothetical protein
MKCDGLSILRTLELPKFDLKSFNFQHYWTPFKDTEASLDVYLFLYSSQEA